MKKNISISDLLALTVSERIELVGDLWDSIAAVPEQVELTESQKAELDRRLREHQDNPKAGSPWEQVKARLKGTA
jgi:putative addiction module component (TIGR02574 family)